MKKRYLKTIKDIEALIPTDTKIYQDNGRGYFKFVNGVLCSFTKNNELSMYNDGLSCLSQDYYIEVEDEQDYIGKLGMFWDFKETADGFIDVLDTIDVQAYGCDKYIPKSNNRSYQYFRPLTPEEVEEYTGYKVVKEK